MKHIHPTQKDNISKISMSKFQYFSPGHEIPKLLTSKVTVLQHGKEGRIYCNITDKGSQATQLRRMLWFKDDELVQNIPAPTPVQDKNLAEHNALVLRNVGVKDAGKYTCVLVVFVRQITEYNVSDDTTVNSE